MPFCNLDKPAELELFQNLKAEDWSNLRLASFEHGTSTAILS